MEQQKIKDNVEHYEMKVKLMVSCGGKIQPRTHDHQLSYAGGDTKILTVDHNIKFLDIVAKVISLFNLNTSQFLLKYQLPGQNLDALVTLTNDEDVENMMFEYDQAHLISIKPVRLKLFLFPWSTCGALNSGQFNPGFLFGLKNEYAMNSTAPQGDSDIGSSEENKRVIEILEMIEIELQSGNNVTSGPLQICSTSTVCLLPVTKSLDLHRIDPCIMYRFTRILVNLKQSVFLI